jgi:hypothetical protein
MTAPEPRGLAAIDPRYRAIYEGWTTGASQRQEALQRQMNATAQALGGHSPTALADAKTAEDHATWGLAVWSEITPTVLAPYRAFIVNAITDEGSLDLAVYAGAVPEWPAEGADVHVGMLAKPFTDLGDAPSTRSPNNCGHGRPVHQPRGAGTHAPPRRRPAPPRTPHDGLLAETGARPPGKHWNRTYTEEQRAVSPPCHLPAATRDAIVALGLGLPNCS